METKETMSVTFKIQGEFITNLAREKCYLEGKYDYAMELLSSCMETEEISKNEILNMAVAILDGRAELKGTYPDEDYGFYYLDEKDNKWDLGKLFSDNYIKIKNTQEKHDDLLQKYLFISYSLDRWDKINLNKEYKTEYDDVLFGDIVQKSDCENTMLESFIKRNMSDTEDDYGWLEPNGIFHPVEWGQHQEWADLWLQQNLSNDDYLKIDCSYSLGDYLTIKGWILLHNPSQGIAIVTKSNECRVTKAQKEFLFNYYMKRDCPDKANDIYN